MRNPRNGQFTTPEKEKQRIQEERIARCTGPAHSGLAPAPQTNYHHRHSDPGPI